MIFDLKGKRRRMVQAVYLLLAVLMGGGLVLFGIGGGSLNGGLLDAFKGGGGSSSGNKAIQQRIDNAQKKLPPHPHNQAAFPETTPRSSSPRTLRIRPLCRRSSATTTSSPR